MTAGARCLQPSGKTHNIPMKPPTKCSPKGSLDGAAFAFADGLLDAACSTENSFAGVRVALHSTRGCGIAGRDRLLPHDLCPYGVIACRGRTGVRPQQSWKGLGVQPELHNLFFTLLRRRTSRMQPRRCSTSLRACQNAQASKGWECKRMPVPVPDSPKLWSLQIQPCRMSRRHRAGTNHSAEGSRVPQRFQHP
jgi:hypothetical protein